LKSPQFWHKKTTISYLLLPLSAFYLLGHFINCLIKSLKKTTIKSNQPIICIGNLIAGGAGKTPVAIAIGQILQELKIDFAYLSSGYGGKIANCTLVDKAKHSAKDVGDEPLLLAEIAATFISKNKQIGVNEIANFEFSTQGRKLTKNKKIVTKSTTKTTNKQLIIMDDGLQNPSITKDFSILIIDGNYCVGNGFLIPAGPLREPIWMGIKKADLVIIIGEDKGRIAKKFCQKFCANKKIIKAQIKPINFQKFINKPAIAFCGIGRPEKFFDSLTQSKINIIAKFSYSDHHQYREKEIQKMIDLAREKNAILITTKKDWVRLDKIYQEQIEFLDIKIEFKNEKYLREKLIGIAK